MPHKLSQNTPAIRKNLTAWFCACRRILPWRDTREPYAIWVSEVMLQQTQVKTVIPYFLSFMDDYPTLEVLAEADLETVLKSWEGLGYYARARNLHRAANRLVSEHDGVIPDEFSAFKALPGVGDYIASAVLSIAFGQPHAVVDGNVKRVFSRLFAMDTPVNASRAHREFKETANLLLDREDPATFNQALMELGALVCTPKSPDCGGCPLARVCQARNTRTVDRYPVRTQRKKVPTYAISAGIVRKGELLLITRRKPEGLLGGLWEFPGGKVKPGETPEQACKREIMEETGLAVRVDSHLTRVKHAYTHFKIEMDVFCCTLTGGEICLNGPVDHRWVTAGQLDEFPFPRANLKFIPMIQESCHEN